MSAQPFSTLNEMQQVGDLSKLLYEDLGAVGTEWGARISAWDRRMKCTSGAATASSKQQAKRMAAARVLERMEADKTALSITPSPEPEESSNSESPATSPGTSPIASPGTSPITSPATSVPTSRVSSISTQPDFVPSPPLTAKQRVILAAARDHLDTMRSLATRRGVSSGSFLSIDVEAFERGTEVLEVGVAWVAGSNAWLPDQTHSKHYIIKEFRHLRNGRYVADNRYRFNFGASEIVSFKQCAAALRELVDALAQDGGPVCLVGHSIAQDLKWLAGLGVGLTGLQSCDIAQVDCAKRQDPQRRKLSAMMDEQGIKYENLHNGGNDAVYTLQCAMRLMEEEERERMELLCAITPLL